MCFFLLQEFLSYGRLVRMTLLQTVTLLLIMSGSPADHPVWGAEAITEALEMTDTDPALLLAVALHETGMRPRAVGLVGETGPWQVHPVHRDRDYHTSCEVFPRSCALWHVQTANRILLKGLEVCKGDLRGALARYNRGHGCRGRLAYSAGVLREYRYVRALMEGE